MARRGAREGGASAPALATCTWEAARVRHNYGGAKDTAAMRAHPAKHDDYSTRATGMAG
jgi:hypothetical protein